MIYLDNAATTPISPVVARHLQSAYMDIFGNSSSSHAVGKQAEKTLEQARESIGSLLEFPKEKIFFSSGATESANIIIQGYAKHLLRTNSPRKEILVSEMEHPAVYTTALSLENAGFTMRIIPNDKNGIIDPQALESMLSEHTAIVAIMRVNNETGTIQPIRELSRLVKQKDAGVLFMTDIVQALGKIPLDITPESVDAWFISGHKIGAPKGTGAFYINSKFRLQPLLFGGGHEGGYRPGTTNVSGAHLLSIAIQENIEQLEKHAQHARTLQYHLINELTKNGIEFKRTIEAEHSSPFIFSIIVPGQKSSDTIQELSNQEIYISSRSACSSNNHSKSRILESLNMPTELIDSVLRISFSAKNTTEEAEAFAKVLGRIVQNRTSRSTVNRSEKEKSFLEKPAQHHS